ncbi:MAG: 4-alpha-glucanotransferase, partial [Desulfocapsaceae bacterium]|nr:4-alpha-glucanotransferase [Desulfocapsaceae bacterium]
FMTSKDVHRQKPWYLWPRELAAHLPAARETIRTKHAQLYDYYQFEQYIFQSQWSELKGYAAEKQIQLIGDIPVYLGLDSADVWSRQELFELDTDTLEPFRVSGVPPDYFSTTGQRWGNPLYRWNSKEPQVQEQLIDWWCDRFTAVFKLVDVARIDHFRGFESYWAIPATEETAAKGTWLKGPGAAFFEKIRTRLGNLNIIAEDLGEITQDVIKLRDAAGFPGMKVLQFAFDGVSDNPFLPHNFSTPHCVVYTGTHDNNTTLGWFLSEDLNDEIRKTIKKMANRELHDSSPIHEDFIFLALSSIAELAIIPLQDILGFGGDCRMNTPGVANGNWMWRCAPEFLGQERAEWLAELTRRFNR